MSRPMATYPGTGKSAWEALDAAVDGSTPMAAALFADAVARLGRLYAADRTRAAALVARWLAERPAP